VVLRRRLRRRVPGLAFSEGKRLNSPSVRVAKARAGDEPSNDDAPPGRIKKEFSTEKGSRCIVAEIICHELFTTRGTNAAFKMAICCAALSNFWLFCAGDKRAGSWAGAVNGDFEEWNCSGRVTTGSPGWRADSRERGGNAVDAAIATNAMMEWLSR